MAIFIKHTGCDRCGSSDALAHYSDGSSFCFSCGVAGGASVPGFSRLAKDDDDESVTPPPDLSYDFPIEVFQWIDPTGLKIEELIKNGYFFSKSTSNLVRVFQQATDSGVHRHARQGCSAYETRRLYHSVRQPKTTFRGSKETTSGIVKANNLLQQEGCQTGSEHWQEGEKTACVIVEDSLSAIKCGRHFDSFPLFGSSISKNKLTWISQPYKKVYVWLDSDKLNNARTIADQLKMIGKQSEVIYTELDPKYLNILDYV